MEYVTLNNGVKIPQFGLGVYSIPAGEVTPKQLDKMLERLGLEYLDLVYLHQPLRDPVINEIAKAHGKSAVQVIIRWHIQKGFCVVPGSSNPKHIEENIEVFDFELTQEEMKKMASLNKEKRYFNMTYKQIKDWMERYELWD